MKKVLTFLFLLSFSLFVSAQQKVALHSNGTTTMYSGATPFIDAYNDAISGDTLYLPGIGMSVPTSINKRLTIFGTGHYPDSTQATNISVLVGSILVNSGADSLFIEGVTITGSLSFENNQSINNVVISRSRIQGNIAFNGDATNPCMYTSIKECAIYGYVNFSNATFSIFSNNICNSQLLNGTNNAIYNNILVRASSYYYYIFVNLDNSYIANNIIVNSGYIITACESSTFAYNVFVSTQNDIYNTFLNNYLESSPSTLFVTQSGVSFSYTDDYHLVTPVNYLGTDGTQIGIYGGLFPYKTAAVPSNPHISSKSIPLSTDVNGMLNININVNAQDE